MFSNVFIFALFAVVVVAVVWSLLDSLRQLLLRLDQLDQVMILNDQYATPNRYYDVRGDDIVLVTIHEDESETWEPITK